MKNSLAKRLAVKTLRALGLRNSAFSERSAAPFRFEIDHFYTVENEGYVLHGWVVDPDHFIESLELTDGRRGSGDILHSAVRRDRPDVRGAFRDLPVTRDVGFLCLIPFSMFSERPLEKLHLRFQLKTGVSLDFALKKRSIEESWDRELYLLLNARLEEIGRDAIPSRNLLKKHDSLESLSSYIRIAVDSCYVIPGGYLFLSGWVVDRDDAITSLKIKQGRTLSKDLRTSGTRYARPDLGDATSGQNGLGISVLVEFDVDEDVDDLSLHIETEKKESLSLDISGVSQSLDVIEMSKRLLAEINFSSREAGPRLAAVGEAIRLAWRAKRSAPSQEEVTQETFGAVTRNPQVSVIVPLYGRSDLMEYQLSQFAIDPDLQDVELIYVVDDPKILDRTLGDAPDLFALYGVAFSVVYGGRNRGFAGANNLGVSCANSDTLLLLNSDVIPKTTGWLSAMKRFHNELDSPGAIAPALLYEDESVQHAGMTFDVHPNIPELWVNVHEYKGLPGSLVLRQQKSAREVPAVTAACLMMTTQVYLELGGLDERYILGDFEDSDLCLKALEKGFKNYFLPHIELYHLERQSQNLVENLSWKQRLTMYNCWEHTEKWGNTIRALKLAREQEAR